MQYQNIQNIEVSFLRKAFDKLTESIACPNILDQLIELAIEEQRSYLEQSCEDFEFDCPQDLLCELARKADSKSLTLSQLITQILELQLENTKQLPSTEVEI